MRWVLNLYRPQSALHGSPRHHVATAVSRRTRGARKVLGPAIHDNSNPRIGVTHFGMMGQSNCLQVLTTPQSESTGAVQFEMSAARRGNLTDLPSFDRPNVELCSTSFSVQGSSRCMYVGGEA